MIVGVDLDYETIQISQGGGMLMVSAGGTAVLIEEKDSAPRLEKPVHLGVEGDHDLLGPAPMLFERFGRKIARNLEGRPEDGGDPREGIEHLEPVPASEVFSAFRPERPGYQGRAGLGGQLDRPQLKFPVGSLGTVGNDNDLPAGGQLPLNLDPGRLHGMGAGAPDDFIAPAVHEPGDEFAIPGRADKGHDVPLSEKERDGEDLAVPNEEDDRPAGPPERGIGFFPPHRPPAQPHPQSDDGPAAVAEEPATCSFF